MKNIPGLIDELEQRIPEYKKLSVKISSSSVGWHIAHSLMALERICNTLINSTPGKVKTVFSLKRIFIMASGHIPRGRANAPAAVKPSADITPDDLQYRLLKVRAVLADLSNAPAEANFVHPVFGRLQKKAGLRFMQIHTQHHLLIIKDIIKNTG